MKIAVYLKDPDGFYDAVKDAATASLPKDLDDDEREAVMETRLEKTWEKLKKWVQYQEYVTIIFDTEAGTATVKEID